MADFDESERRRDGDRRASDRRQFDQPICGEDRRSGEDRRLAQRRFEYDKAVDAAKAALIRYGLDSPAFAAAAEESEQARQRLNEFGGPNTTIEP